MSLQPISSSQLPFEIGNPLLRRSLSVRVGLGEHLSPQQVLERALMQALSSTDVGVAQAFLRQSGLQLTEMPARQQFQQHAVYNFTPPPDFWPQVAAFRENNANGNQTNITGQSSASVPTRNPRGAEAFAIRSLFASLKAKWLQVLSRATTNGTSVDARINANQVTGNGQTQVTTANAQPAVVSQSYSTPQTASAQVQLTPQTLVTMSAAQLKAQPEAAKKQLLMSLGVSSKHLKKLKGDKLDKALAQVAQALRTPGKHKVTLKLDKKYELKTQIGADGRIESFGLKKKKGFFGKLWDGVKAIAPIAGYVLAPFTGGLSLVASAAIGAVDAVKNKNWLGAITSVAGAFVPGAGNIAGKAIGQIASTVQKVAFTAQGVFAAVEGRNPLSLVGSVAGGFANFAGGVGNVSSKVLETSERVQRWANLALRGQSIIRAASSGDFFGAATGALGTAAGLTKDSSLRSDLAKYADWADRANTARWAIRTKNYAAAANSALSLAVDVRQQTNLKVSGRNWLNDALRLTESGARLEGALRSKDPMLMGQAVLSLGSTLETFRGSSREAGGVGGELGAGLYRTANMLKFADTAIRAVKEGRTSDAAALGLGLAAELSGDQRVKEAAEVGQSAVVLMRAIRSKNVMMIKLAGENFLKEVGLGRLTAERERDQLLTQARERQETLEARDVATEPGDLASRFGLTPPFVPTAIATPPFVASSSDGQTLDAPPVLGRQLFEPQLVTTPTISPLFSTTPPFVPARSVAPEEDLESEVTSTDADLLAEFTQRNEQRNPIDRDKITAQAGQKPPVTDQDVVVIKTGTTVYETNVKTSGQTRAELYNNALNAVSAEELQQFKAQLARGEYIPARTAQHLRQALNVFTQYNNLPDGANDPPMLNDFVRVIEGRNALRIATGRDQLTDGDEVNLANQLQSGFLANRPLASDRLLTREDFLARSGSRLENLKQWEEYKSRNARPFDIRVTDFADNQQIDEYLFLAAAKQAGYNEGAARAVMAYERQQGNALAADNYNNAYPIQTKADIKGYDELRDFGGQQFTTYGLSARVMQELADARVAQVKGQPLAEYIVQRDTQDQRIAEEWAKIDAKYRVPVNELDRAFIELAKETEKKAAVERVVEELKPNVRAAGTDAEQTANNVADGLEAALQFHVKLNYSYLPDGVRQSIVDFGVGMARGGIKLASAAEGTSRFFEDGAQDLMLAAAKGVGVNTEALETRLAAQRKESTQWWGAMANMSTERIARGEYAYQLKKDLGLNVKPYDVPNWAVAGGEIAVQAAPYIAVGVLTGGASLPVQVAATAGMSGLQTLGETYSTTGDRGAALQNASIAAAQGAVVPLTNRLGVSRQIATDAMTGYMGARLQAELSGQPLDENRLMQSLVTQTAMGQSFRFGTTLHARLEQAVGRPLTSEGQVRDAFLSVVKEEAAKSAKTNLREVLVKAQQVEGRGPATDVQRAAKPEAIRLIEAARPSEPAITKDLTKIANEVKGEIVGLDSRFKTQESLTRKLADRAAQRIDRLTKRGMSREEAINATLDNEAKKANDVLRYTIIFSTEHYGTGYEATLTALERQGYRIDNRYNAWETAGTDGDTGYRGINTTVIAPNGQKFEFQFHTPESFRVKTVNHRFYEEVRDPLTSKQRADELIRIQIESAKTIPTPLGLKVKGGEK